MNSRYKEDREKKKTCRKYQILQILDMKGGLHNTHAPPPSRHNTRPPPDTTRAPQKNITHTFIFPSSFKLSTSPKFSLDSNYQLFRGVSKLMATCLKKLEKDRHGNNIQLMNHNQ